MAVAPPAQQPRRLVLRERLHIIDYAILLLAVASVMVFLLDVATNLTGIEAAALMYVDIALSVVYGALFLVKTILAPNPVHWVRRHILLAFGILPLTIPLLTPPRFHIIVQVVVIALRAGKALDRAFGEHILGGLVERYRYMLVEELTDPLLLRLAIVLEDAVVERDYAAAIGKRLDERRDLVEQAVKRAIEASPKLSRLSSFGPVQRWVDETTEEIVDAAHAALTGPELNTLIREGLEDAFAELKLSIVERKWQRKGLGVRDLAAGVLASAATAREGER